MCPRDASLQVGGDFRVGVCRARGRGARSNPANRFETLAIEFDPEAIASIPEDERPAARTIFLKDHASSVLTRNDSPDIGFEVSLNPYRGCEHGCAYCYARPYHEFLGFSAGLDFETRIMVKEDAPELLRAELERPSWRPTPIAFGSATDVYQPVERRLGLTRRCLEVLAEFRQPVAIITKNHLVTRDADLLARLAEHQASSVTLSITTLDPALSRVLEPRASLPLRRLDAIERLRAAGVPVGVNIAPIIPGLTEHEVPSILRVAAQAGAQFAGWGMLRLPLGVKGIFLEWLDIHFPGKRARVLARIRDVRQGRLDESRFGVRMTGAGLFAEQIRLLFAATARHLGLRTDRSGLSCEAFRRPGPEQMRLAL